MKELLRQLSYITMVEDSGIEPLTQACKASVFPIRLIPQNLLLTIYPSLRRQQRRVYGPCDTIRTCDHLVPNQELYQAELHTVIWYLDTVSNRGPSPCKGDALPLSYPGKNFGAGSRIRTGFFSLEG